MRNAISLLVVLVAGCEGKAPPDPGTLPDAGEADAAPDAGLDVGQLVSGTAMDYFGNVALQDTTITTDGIDPPATTTSAIDGSYTVQVAVGSKMFFVTAKTMYRPTRSVPVSVNDMPVKQDVYIMSTVDITRQYTTLGKTAVAGTAFVAAELEMTDGTPITGIPLTNVQLLDSLNQPVPNVTYAFFGTAGDVDPAVTTATAYGTPPKTRVAILDVPPGTYTLAVTYPVIGGGTTQNTTTLSTAADGATLALSGGTAVMGTAPADPSFATDVYPRLQKAANGGLGCANCHTAGGTAGNVLVFDDPAATVLTNMQAATGVIDATTPANSLFLTMPLYEPPPALQNHPNATFLDTNDPDYQLFLSWITKGAKP